MNNHDPLDDEKRFRLTLGQKVAEARKRAGISQQGLSEKLDVNRPTLSKIELGNTHVDIYTILLICRALGLDIDYFVPGSGDTYNDESQPVRVGLTYIAKGAALVKRGETIVRNGLSAVMVN